MSRTLIYRAGKDDEGRTVRDVIREDFRLVAHDIARAKYRTADGITVDGMKALVSRPLRAGEELRVILDSEEPEKIVPVPGDLMVLYEDEDVLCVNKPAGMVVHPSHGHFSDTLSNRVAWYYLSRGEAHEVRPAGRLDKDTSGVLVFGKSRSASAHLQGQTGNFPIRKVYAACAEGYFEERSGTIEKPISREYEEKIRRVVRSDGDRAVTHYRVVSQREGYAVLLLTLETGRTHQIRVHMESIGHPLVGDPIYNRARGAEGPGRAALHAWKAEFGQPFTGERIEVTAPVPDDLRAFIGDALSGEGEEAGAGFRQHHKGGLNEQ